jgi:hypothetical protein
VYYDGVAFYWCPDLRIKSLDHQKIVDAIKDSKLIAGKPEVVDATPAAVEHYRWLK